jgi:hypothetical protein
MKRRTALKVLTGGAVAANLPAGVPRPLLVQIATKPEAYRLLFFSDAENALLETLSEMIIPADEHSGGAAKAHVSFYMDVVVAHSERQEQDAWRSALRGVDEEARRRFGKSFLDCAPESRDRMMADWAAKESNPQTERERFFVKLKSLTTTGYYTTEVGLLEELGYKGNTAIGEFKGCTHQTHEATRA